MNGQDVHTFTSTSDQKAASPISHCVGASPRNSRIWLAAPLGCRMNRHSVAATNAGSTYGMRNAERTSARPRKRVFSAIAASRPTGAATRVVSAAIATLIHTECSRLALPNAST